MINVALHRGTRNYSADPSLLRHDFCTCGNVKFSVSKVCQRCHMARIGNERAVRQAARRKMQRYLKWLEEKRKEE